MLNFKSIKRKTKGFIDRLKYIWNMPDTVREYNNLLARNINRVEDKINERTTIHADIGYKGTGSQIIVIGRYRNKDYVRSFNVRQESLSSLIEMLKQEEHNAGVGKFDMIGGIEFSAVYDRDKF